MEPYTWQHISQYKCLQSNMCLDMLNTLTAGQLRAEIISNLIMEGKGCAKYKEEGVRNGYGWETCHLFTVVNTNVYVNYYMYICTGGIYIQSVNMNI